MVLFCCSGKVAVLRYNDAIPGLIFFHIVYNYSLHRPLILCNYRAVTRMNWSKQTGLMGYNVNVNCQTPFLFKLRLGLVMIWKFIAQK